MNRNIFLSGLKDVKINREEIWEHPIQLSVEMLVKPRRCPRCGTEGRKIHDYRIQKIRNFQWFERTTVIFYRKRRSVCRTCGKRFAEQNPFVERSAVFQRVEPGLVYAEHSCQNVQRHACSSNQYFAACFRIHAKMFKDLAFQFGVSVSAVIRRFDAAAKKEL